MDKISLLKWILLLLDHPKPESLNLSIKNCHGDGIFSLVIDGTKHGRLTRIFIAEKKLMPFQAQLHTHRYPLILTAIKGNILHHVANIEQEKESGVLELSLYDYLSPLNGGNGLTFVKDVHVSIQSYNIPPSATILLSVNEFHTMSVSKGSIWIVEEMGFEVDKSQVLGVPFTTDGLYTQPSQFDINDKVQYAKKYIKQMLRDFDSIPNIS